MAALLTRYYPRVSRVVALRMGRKLEEFVDQEDIIQESMLDAFCGLASFEIRGEGSFLSWMATIVENKIRSGLRHMQAEKRGGGALRPMGSEGSVLLDSFEGTSVPTPSQHAVRNELSERLEHALLSLPPRQRRAVDMHRICKMSYREIADELGLAESSARALVARALGRVSALLR